MEDNLEPTNGPDEFDDELQNEPVNELDDERQQLDRGAPRRYL